METRLESYLRCAATSERQTRKPKAVVQDKCSTSRSSALEPV